VINQKRFVKLEKNHNAIVPIGTRNVAGQNMGFLRGRILIVVFQTVGHISVEDFREVAVGGIIGQRLRSGYGQQAVVALSQDLTPLSLLDK